MFVREAGVDQRGRGPGQPRPVQGGHPVQRRGPGHRLHRGPALFTEVPRVVHEESIRVLKSFFF